MTSAAQLESNRSNAQRSTGPKTETGKERSSPNAVKHGFTGRLLVGLQHGPFADNPVELQEFIQAVLTELAPVTALVTPASTPAVPRRCDRDSSGCASFADTRRSHEAAAPRRDDVISLLT